MAPKSPLSFVYHITEVAPYRDEMHHDIRQAFQRFGIDRQMMQRVSSNADDLLRRFQVASYDIERAAYTGRTDPNERLHVPMPDATQNLFAEMVPLLAWEIENGVPEPDLPPPPAATGSLLCAVHFLFYSSAFRAANPAAPEPREPVAIDMAAFGRAWSKVRTALDQPAGARPQAASVAPELTTLMTGLATEFSDSLWSSACW